MVFRLADWGTAETVCRSHLNVMQMPAGQLQWLIPIIIHRSSARNRHGCSAPHPWQLRAGSDRPAVFYEIRIMRYYMRLRQVEVR